MSRKFLGVLLFAAMVGAAGCDNEVEDATQPQPPPPTTTETFTGTLTVNGAQTHPFTVTTSGQVQVTISELSTADSTVGLFLGTVGAGTCTSVVANDNAKLNTAVIANAAGAGAVCTRIHDVGKLTGPVDYKLTVVHP